MITPHCTYLIIQQRVFVYTQSFTKGDEIYVFNIGTIGHVAEGAELRPRMHTPTQLQEKGLLVRVLLIVDGELFLLHEEPVM